MSTHDGIIPGTEPAVAVTMYSDGAALQLPTHRLTVPVDVGLHRSGPRPDAVQAPERVEKLELPVERSDTR